VEVTEGPVRLLPSWYRVFFQGNWEFYIAVAPNRAAQECLMYDRTETASTVKPVRAILHGGPENIPDDKRVQLVSPHDEKIKLPHYGGYEHFERIGGLDVSVISEEILFFWTTRTEVAE
jgi:hypothetical protein